MDGFRGPHGDVVSPYLLCSLSPRPGSRQARSALVRGLLHGAEHSVPQWAELEDQEGWGQNQPADCGIILQPPVRPLGYPRSRSENLYPERGFRPERSANWVEKRWGSTSLKTSKSNWVGKTRIGGTYNNVNLVNII